MARAALLALILVSAPALPEGCAKLLGKSNAAPPGSSSHSPPALPVTSATAPPIWTPPDTGQAAPAPTPAVAANPDLAKAKAAHQAGEHKKVRALLEKKVKSGKATHEEAMLLQESCTVLKDKACLGEVRAKFPDG